MDIKIPKRGFIFWPVGTGDSTTVAAEDGLLLQVDLHHLAQADDTSEPTVPIVDQLVKILPKRDGKPYLAGFALTHPDADHCLGFADLLKRVTIGEIWLTPRIFTEYKQDLVPDALAFQVEAERRVKATIAAAGNAGSGDRLWIIGDDDILEEDAFKGFPPYRHTIPGDSIHGLDGNHLRGRFRAFIHAPSADDCDGDRNDSSLGMQVTLAEGSVLGQALLLGDLCYPTVNSIFAKHRAEGLSWNVFLAPHHCSKSVLYWQDPEESEPTFKQELASRIEAASVRPGRIVASACPIPSSNAAGDNPPHAIAKHRYQEIAPDGFLCTMEHPNTELPTPIIFSMEASGLVYAAPMEDSTTILASVISGIKAARGTAEPPTERVGFGGGLD